MLPGYDAFEINLKRNNIKTFYKQYMKFLRRFNFYQMLNFGDFDQESIQKMKESNVIIIGSYHNEKIIVCFQDNLIIFKQDHLNQIKSLFSDIYKGKVFILPNSYSKIKKLSQKDYSSSVNNNIDQIKIFNGEIKEFSRSFNILCMEDKSINEFWNIICPYLSAYLIKESYFKNNEDRLFNFLSNIKEPKKSKIFNFNDFIYLRPIGNSATSTTSLYYHIESEKLFAIKMQNSNESDRYIKREKANYEQIYYPFIPRYYGEVDSVNTSIVIEYINGSTLSDPKKLNLSSTDKIISLIELILTFKYLHSQKFIYRDLKPNNVIYDINKRTVLIDFDRMVEYDKIINDASDYSKSMNPGFIAPEILLGQTSYKSDIYSLGVMIVQLFDSVILKDGKINVSKLKNMKIKEIVQRCINEKRPELYEVKNFITNYYKEIDPTINIKEITNHIYLLESIDDLLLKMQNLNEKEVDSKICYIMGLFHLKNEDENGMNYITDAVNQNNPDAQNFLGCCHLNGNYLEKDDQKAIHYFQLAANQNHSIASFNLGLIYCENQNDMAKGFKYIMQAADQNEAKALNYIGYLYLNGIYVQKNVNKGINYIKRAADNNCAEAHFSLGIIFYEKQPKDIKKAIYYLDLSAQQDLVEAQYYLGDIYFKDAKIGNIKKAFYYLKMAADNNYLDAQYDLAVLYLDNKMLDKRDESIDYLAKAANNNHLRSQYLLSLIYNKGEFVKPDNAKSIDYLTLCAKQNDLNSQFTLGLLYLEGKIVKQDLNKGFLYLKMSADKNYLRALFILGMFYFEGRYINQDIDKSIFYLTKCANQSNLRLSFEEHRSVMFSQYNLGFIYCEDQYKRKDLKEALKYFKLAADQGQFDAQFQYAKLCFNKYEKSQIDIVIHYLKLASDQDHYIAQYWLGNIFSDLELGKYDIPQAIHYLTLSSYLGYADSQNLLGILYYESFYHCQDVTKAIYYFKLAADQNIYIAQCYLGLIYYEGKYVKRDVKLAIDYLLKAANKNYASAQKILGVFYFEGKYIPRNIKESIRYLTCAANQNDYIAQFNLCNIYINTHYDDKFLPRIIAMLKNSVEHGVHEAQVFLGDFYVEGKYVKRDIKKAVHLYLDPSSFNNQYAKNNLGVIYKNDFDNNIRKNVCKAKEYFEEAIRQKNDIFAKYNLANLLLDEGNYDGAVKLLAELSIQNFKFSHMLFCLAIMMKNGFVNEESIQNELLKYNLGSNNLAETIYNCFSKMSSIILPHTGFSYEIMYLNYRTNDLTYCHGHLLLKSSLNSIVNPKQK